MEKEQATRLPSEEKIWMQYYPEEAKILDMPKFTLYQYIYDRNKDHLNQVALELWKQKVTYRDLFRQVDICSALFEKDGIVGENNALVCLPGICQVPYLLLAASKIGSTLDMIAPTFSKEHLLEVMNESKSKILFLFEDFYTPEMAEAIEKSSIEKVVIVKTASLLPKGIRRMEEAQHCLEILKKKKIAIPKDSRFISWEQYMKIGSNLKIPETVSDNGQDLVTVYSSGTTGEPKGIVHGNEAFTTMIRQHELSGMRFIRGNLFFSAIPTWFMTGLCNCMMLPLGLGVSILLDPRIEQPEVIAKYFATRTIHYTIFPTTRLMAMFKSKKMQHADLSEAIYYVAGGEPLPIGTDKWCSAFLQAHKAETKMQKGYGRAEDGACTTVTNEKFNDPDTVGIPLPWVNARVVDIDTGKELSYNQRGILHFATPGKMKRYKNNDFATAQNFSTDEKGIVWSNTRDIGYIDQKGGIHVLGRETDYILDSNHEKVYLFDIANVLFQNEAVVECEVVGLTIDNGRRIVPVAHVVLAEEYLGQEEKILYELNEQCLKAFAEKPSYIPMGFKFRRKFERAKAGKRDIEALKKERTAYAKPLDHSYCYLQFPEDGLPCLDCQAMHLGKPLAEPTTQISKKKKVLEFTRNFEK